LSNQKGFSESVE